jgi:hypothetical protein
VLGKDPAVFGAPGGIRTPDQRIRNPLLYPSELRARALLNRNCDETLNYTVVGEIITFG